MNGILFNSGLEKLPPRHPENSKQVGTHVEHSGAHILAAMASSRTSLERGGNSEWNEKKMSPLGLWVCPQCKLEKDVGFFFGRRKYFSISVQVPAANESMCAAAVPRQRHNTSPNDEY